MKPVEKIQANEYHALTSATSFKSLKKKFEKRPVRATSASRDSEAVGRRLGQGQGVISEGGDGGAGELIQVGQRC